MNKIIIALSTFFLLSIFTPSVQALDFTISGEGKYDSEVVSNYSDSKTDATQSDELFQEKWPYGGTQYKGKLASGVGFDTKGSLVTGTESGLYSEIPNSYDFEAETGWSQKYINESESPKSYTLDLSIHGGELLLFENSDNNYIANSKYTMQVLLDGSPIWSSSAHLYGQHSNNHQLDTSGDVPKSKFFANAEESEWFSNIYKENMKGTNDWNDIKDNLFGYSFSSLDVALDLGEFDQDESFNLEYSLAVETNGSGADTGRSGSYAIFTDPSGMSSTSSNTSSAPVPEPTTILLLGTGLIGLASIGRQKFFKRS